MHSQGRMRGLAVIVAFWVCAGQYAPAQDGAETIEKAIADLQSPNSNIRTRASAALLKEAPDIKEAIPALNMALDDSSPSVRLNAAEAIGMMGSEAAPAVPGLMKAIKRHDWSGTAQIMAARALDRIGPAATEAVPVLVEVLANDEISNVRCEAARALASVGSADKATLPALKKALLDENGFVKVAAATALWQAGRDKTGLPILIEALKDQSIVGTRVAADALADIGPAAQEAIPALTEALADPASSARVAAARALWLIAGNSEVIPVLIPALQAPYYEEVRERAAETLGLIIKAKANESQLTPAEKAQILAATEALETYEQQKAARLKKGTTLVFEAEDCTGPADAILKDKDSANRWKLLTTHSTASKGTSLVSPPVPEDRATPEDGAPVLHTHITDIPNGQYTVEATGARALAISTDAGETWKRIEGNRSVGTFEITDGTFDLWVDDRYAAGSEKARGPSYYDTLVFTPSEATPREVTSVAKVHGWAKERVREKLSRGTNAARLPEGGVYVNWRLLEDDPEDVAFDVYRHVEGMPPRQINEKPITRTTDFVDQAAPADTSCRYSIRLAGKGADQVSSPPVPAVSADLPYTSIKFRGDYSTGTVAIADLDGDGRYDYVIRQPNYSIWKMRGQWRRSTEVYKLEAYDADGNFLWRRNMGWGVELWQFGAAFIAYDLDGDGRAEVACMAGDVDARDAEGRTDKGPEFVAVLDGMTGEERCRIPFLTRVGFPGLYARSTQICVGYLDGKTPCLIMERGTYNLMKLAACQLRDNQLEQFWNWSNLDLGKEYWGQGAHTTRVTDVDGDGRDEIVLGSCVVDDDGSSLWSTGIGHIDQCLVGDIDPLHPGLEMYYVAENRKQKNGIGLVDAATGKWLWAYEKPTNHVGFGLVSDFDASHPGCECTAGEDPKGDPQGRRYEGNAPNWFFSAQGELLAENSPKDTIVGRMPSRAAWWDGDLQRELLAGGQITKYKGSVYPPTVEGAILTIADVTGDWREEIITCRPGELRIYSTRIPAQSRQICLMQDPTYRLCVAANSQAYCALPQLGITLSSNLPQIQIKGPGGDAMPGQEIPCSVTVIAPVKGSPISGILQLSAESDCTLTPNSFPVQVAPGQNATFPFTLHAPTPPPIDGRSLLNGTAILNLDNDEPITGEFSFSVIAVPFSGVPIAEAEDFVEEVGGNVVIRDDKVGVSGKAFSHWRDQNHRLTWNIEVPTAGRYHFAVRYSCVNPAERTVLIDGRALPGAEKICFPVTGGFGSSAGEWNNTALRMPDGQPATWDLSVGTHTMVLDNPNGSGVNIDQLALVPAQ